MKQLQDRVTVITGASRGLGEEIADAYAAEGANVVLAARTAADLDRVAERCLASGAASAMTLVTDVSQEADMALLAARTRERYGRIDVWVNNAGLGLLGLTEERFTSLVDVETSLWEALLRINFTSQFLGIKYGLPQLIEGGSMINVGSESARQGNPRVAVYNASKAGIDVLTRSAATEAADRGVRVNGLSPGRMADTYLFGPNRMADGFKARVPWVAAEIIRNAAVWLASDGSRDVNNVFVSAYEFDTLGEQALRDRFAAGDTGWGLILL